MRKNGKKAMYNNWIISISIDTTNLSIKLSHEVSLFVCSPNGDFNKVVDRKSDLKLVAMQEQPLQRAGGARIVNRANWLLV